MEFTPKSEKQIAEENLRPAGVYSFEIVDSVDAVSKSGNDMIKLSLHVYNQSGDSCGVISDYLLEKLAYKLRHASFACGLGEKYNNGSLSADDFIGKAGDVKIMIKKDKTGQYPDQNMIADYLVKKDEHKTLDNLDDGIPF